MSRTVAEMVNKLTATGRTITTTTEVALRAMADKTQAEIQAEARSVVPDMRLSRVGKKGAAIGVRIRIGRTRAEIRPTGPWQFIETNTKPHIITARGLRGSIKSRQNTVAGGGRLRVKGDGKGSRLKTPWGPRMYVRHPGTKGQYPWRDGVSRAVPQLPEVAAKVYRQQISRIFR